MSEMPSIAAEQKVKPLSYDDLWRQVLKITAKGEVIRRKHSSSVEDGERALDLVVQEWMDALEGSGRFAAVMDLLPESPTRQLGGRLFVGGDGSSFLVSEPRPFRVATGHLDVDVQEPKRHTFFLPPNEADEMRRCLRQTNNIKKIFGRTWHTTAPSYGMVPFQISPEGADIELILDDEGEAFSLHPMRRIDLKEDVDLFQHMLYICNKGIADVRLQEPDSRQIAQAA
ncbi:hypothetical protein KBD61_02205 [Patescibacteria group bacterium]|nr:hypothetical protein [Patescibacteria group bacterium]MBP9709821.1 hypothetical protein [Patescibacteria group bacterium]